jgi:hypothetical protein
MRTHISKPDLQDPVQRLDPSLLEDVIDPPPAPDRPLDGDEAERDGQTWLEAMGTTAAENGTDVPIDQLIDEELHGVRHRRS